MTTKRQRFRLLLAAGLVLSIGVVLVLTALEENIIFFYSPTDLKKRQTSQEQRFRLGGLVQVGSIIRTQGTQIRFQVTDYTNHVPVFYTGILPDLFREGQGVVAEGYLDVEGVFHAAEVLAKHDETYMPKEVADALKRAGQWQGSQETAVKP